MSRQVDALSVAETHALAPQPSPVSRECRPACGVDHPVTGHAVVLAVPHDVTDRTGCERPADKDCHETVGRDASRRDAPDDDEDAA
jgi:hypothetical protein